MKFHSHEKNITRGIGLGVFLLLTTYLLAFVIFGRPTGLILVLLIVEILLITVLVIIFFRQGQQGRALVVPLASGILLSIVTVIIAIFIGTTLIHAPLPPPESPAWSSGSPVIGMAVSTDEISTSSPEARDLLIGGLTIASRNNQFAAAIPYYDQALAIDPDFPEAWMAKGVALHNLGSYAEAVSCLDRALAIDPGNPAAWSLKGIILDSWGRPDEAAACYRKAGDLDSRYHTAPSMTAIPTPPLPVQAGGDVWLGECCLDVSSIVTSGQIISWYKNDRNVGNIMPDVSRIVYDSHNFSVNPDEFLGFEGNWYLGTTDKIAFVVKVPILDTNSTSAN
ncbi:MAG: tetratricopeptide repeat protein [Methanoregulaceae archaeon]